MRTLLLAAALALTPALADDLKPFSLNDFDARVDEAVPICNADPGSAECRVQMLSVMPSAIEALTRLGMIGSYGEVAPLLRDFAAYPVPQVQASAIYALARLGPTTADMPVLKEALLSGVPALRRAALGALKTMADPVAQEFYARAVPSASTYPRLPSGTVFEPDRLPFDPKDAGVATWPKGARFLFFQAGRDKGTYAFVASASVADIVAAFEAQAGTKAVGMGDIQGRFGATYGDLLAPWAERNAKLGAVQAVILKDSAPPSTSAPVTLALVYEDYALGQAGFALVRLPASPLPAPPTPPDETFPLAKEGDKPWFEAGKFTPKGTADKGDDMMWEIARTGDRVDAQLYLQRFPQGAWKAEAEAVLAAPGLETDFDVYGEYGSPIAVKWMNLPAGFSGRLVLGLTTDSNVRDNAAQDAVTVTTSSGEGQLDFDPSIPKGVYDVRLITDRGELVASTPLRIALAGADIKLASDKVAPGADVVIDYDGMSGDKYDMICINKQGDSDLSYGQISAYTDGAKSGRMTLKAPTQPGAYEVRVYFKYQKDIRARVPLTVGEGAPAPVATPAAPAEPPAPAPTPAPEESKPAPAASQEVTIKLAKPIYATYEPVVVTVGGLPGGKYDFVSIVPAGSIDATTYYFRYTEGKTEGTFSLPGVPVGKYEIRVHFDGKTEPVRGRLPVEVR